MKDIECCANCKYCLAYPKNNSYGDIAYLCAINGFFLHSITKENAKLKRYSPGGKELICKFEQKT